MNSTAKVLIAMNAVELVCYGTLRSIAGKYQDNPISGAIVTLPTVVVLALASVAGFITVWVYLISILRKRTRPDTVTATLAVLAVAVFGFMFGAFDYIR